MRAYGVYVFVVFLFGCALAEVTFLPMDPAQCIVSCNMAES
jgi:hypothetical protein